MNWLVALIIIAAGAHDAAGDTNGNTVRVETMSDAVAHCATVGEYYDAKDCILDAYDSFGSDSSLDVCEYEESMNCIWYANHGYASFIDWDGVAYYLPNVYAMEV